MPNILQILVDDLGFNDLSGGCGVATPNIDSIRHNGILFTQAYAGQATCAPSRAALLTGRFPTRFGIEFTPGNRGIAKILTLPKPKDHFQPILHKDILKVLPPMSEMVLSLNETMFSTVLQAGGYDTYHIGKWDCGPDEGYRPLERGFNESLSFNLGGAPYLEAGNPELVNGYGNEFDDFLRWVLRFHIDHNNGPLFQPDKYMTDYLSERAVDLIHTRAVRDGEEQQMDPFFLSLAYNAPHNPYQALRSDYEDPEVQKLPTQMGRVYAAMIKALDRGVGKVLLALKDANLYDNTMIIFTSDGGGANYAGLPATNAPFRGWKGSLFEGGIHVPMYIQWPKVIPTVTDCTWDLEETAQGARLCEQLTVDSPVSHVDIFTSLMSLLPSSVVENHVHNHLDGINLFDLVHATVKKHNLQANNSTAPVIDRSSLLQQALTEEKSRTRTLYWRSGHYMAVRVGDWKLQLAERPDKVWFYHLKTDPHEWRNLALQVNVTTQASLQSMLQRLPLATAEENGLLESTHTSEEALTSSYFVAQQLRRIYDKLVEMDAQQAPPAWPAAAETPVIIDKDVTQKQHPNDEYIYWSN